LIHGDDGEVYDLSYARKAAAILITLPLLVMYTEAVLIPSLPTIQKQFHVTPSDVSWVLSIYLLTGSISVAVLGKLGDMYGKRRLFLIALTVYAVGVTFTGFAPSFPLLLLARGLQGIGMAIFPLGFTIVREEFPPRMVPQVQGMISAMFGIGMAVALPVGSYIAENYGWEWTYHTVIPFVLLILFLTWRVIRESRYITPGKMDWVGILLLVVFASTALVGVTRAPHIGWSNPQTLVLLATSLASLAVFIVYERRAANPVVPIHLLAEGNVLIANIGIFLAGFAIQMMNQAIIYVLQMPPPYGYGKNILDSGLLVTPNAIGALIAAPLAGRYMTRIGAKPLVALGAVLATAGLLLLSTDPVGMGIPRLISLVVLVSSSIAVLNVSLINVLIFSVGKRHMGIATGLNSLFRNLGASWGPAVAGTLMTMYYTLIHIPTPRGMISLKIPTETAFRYLFMLSAALYVLLFALSTMIREVVKMPPEAEPR